MKAEPPSLFRRGVLEWDAHEAERDTKPNPHRVGRVGARARARRPSANQRAGPAERPGLDLERRSSRPRRGESVLRLLEASHPPRMEGMKNRGRWLVNRP